MSSNLQLSRRARIAALLTVIGVLSLWLAPAASAHHSILSGVSSCATDGTQKITWTVTNSETTAGSNRTEEVTAISVSKGALGAGVAVGTKLAPQTSATYTRNVVSTGYTGSDTSTVTLSVSARWLNSNGTAPDPPITNSATANVTLKGGCKTPPDPKATVEQNCDDGARITLKNDGQTDTTFNVFKNNVLIDPAVAVAAGATVVKKYAMTEDETAIFKVTSGAFSTGDKSLTNNCTNPGAKIDQSCDEGGAFITLTNTGAKKAVTFDIYKGGQVIKSVLVSAGGTEHYTSKMNEDETATFRVKTAGYDSNDVSVTNDCTNPKAIVIQDCEAGGAVFTLTNQNGHKTVTFDISKGGQVIKSIAVAPNATEHYTSAMTEDEKATFRVKTSDGYDSKDIELVNNCTNPGSTTVQSCDEGGALFTLTNLNGQKAVTFDISKGGQVIKSVLVSAGGTEHYTSKMNEDETATFRVKTADGYDSKDVQLTNNCTNPGADVVQSCDAGGAKVTLTNTSATKATTFKVFKDGAQVGNDVVVAPNETKTVNVAIAEDGTAVVKATSGAFSFEKSVKNDCTNPAATVAKSCADGGAKVTLTNPGAKKPVTFQVFKDGVKVGNDVVVAAGATQTVIVPIDEDDTATIKVTGTDFPAYEQSVTQDCTNPDALVAQSCADGGAVFNLSNTGVSPTTFQIFKNGTQTGDDIVVAASGTTKKVVAMAEDEKSTFQVKTTDGFVSKSVELVNNCTNPGATLTHECGAGGAIVTLTNTSGRLPVNVDVFKNGTKVDTFAVPAGGSVVNTYPMSEGETSAFRATSGAFDSGTVTLTHDCTKPGAAIVQSCTAGGAFFSLVNQGELPEGFQLFKNAVAIDSVTVGAGSSVSKTYAMTEDETATYRATTADGFDSGVISLTHNCTPTEVLGVQFEAPRSLPRTGASPFPMSLKAVALLGLGVVILRLRVLLFGRGI